MKLCLEEPGTPIVRDAIAEARLVATSRITMVEARAALSRRRWASNLSAPDHRRIVVILTEEWDRFLRIEIDEPLVRAASRLAEGHRLRGYDAVHLASAMAVAADAREPVVFGSWDDALDAAARRTGLQLLRRPPSPGA